MTALVIGGTGLIGREVLHRLANTATFTEVYSVGRNIVPEAPSSIHQHVMDLLNDDLPEEIQPDVVFCCLGTTIRVAGSQEAFRRVDYEMPLKIAKEVRNRGASHFIVVTSLGANSSSKTFYTRVKGELERDLQQLGYPSLTFVRPSLLLGDRHEPRFGEQVAMLLMLTFSRLIPRAWRAVSARAVAEAMVRVAGERRVGVRVVENAEI